MQKGNDSLGRLVFLGIDGVGKTSLSKYTASKIGAVYYKDTIYKERFFGNSDYCYHTSFALMQFFQQSSERIVMDRWFWDEVVYGAIDKRFIRPHFIDELDEMAWKCGFKIVYLHKDNPREDEIWPKGVMQTLRDNYYRILDKTKCQVLTINTNDENTEAQFKRLLDYASYPHNK